MSTIEKDVILNNNSTTHISSYVMGTIWLLSLAGILIHFLDLFDSVPNPTRFILKFYIFLSTFQQIRVYFEIHKIESKPKNIIKEYGEWINLNIEKIVRYFIFISLLFGAGKITHAIYPMFSCEGKVGSRSLFCELIQPNGKYHDNIFIIGTILVFLFLIIWNICSIKYQRNIGEVKSGRKNWITFRIVLFIISFIFALTYWIYILFSGISVGAFAMITVVIYCFFTILALVLSNKSILDWVCNTFSDC